MELTKLFKTPVIECFFYVIEEVDESYKYTWLFIENNDFKLDSLIIKHSENSPSFKIVVLPKQIKEHKKKIWKEFLSKS